MREIGPHKLKSFVTPPDYDDAVHWLSALNWSDALKDYLEAEQVGELFVSEIEINNKNSTVEWDGKNWVSKRNAE